MAPLPVIGNCVRVAINWTTVVGIRPVNVFHLITSSTNESEIGEALDDTLDAITGNPFAVVMDNYAIESWSITLLSSASATQIVTSTTSKGGTGGGNLVPQVAGVLSMRTAQRGSRGRGRLFLGPCGESDIDSGNLAIGIPPAMVAAWQEWADELAANPLNISFGVASYTHEEVNGVTSFSMRRPCGTQRRRQDQIV